MPTWVLLQRHSREESRSEWIACAAAPKNAALQGQQVATAATATPCIWRRIVGAALVLALVIQGLSFALASGALAAKLSTDLPWSASELCQHDQNSATGPSTGLPASDADCDKHCISCLAVGTHIFAAPELSLRLVFTVAKLRWSLTEWPFAPRSIRSPNARPRGPPLSA
jgi:hypothetical protein